MSIEAMKQALEALEELNKVSVGVDAVCLPGEIDTAMDALRTAIAEAEKQEPVAWMTELPPKEPNETAFRFTAYKFVADEWENSTPLYAAPAWQATPVAWWREDGSICIDESQAGAHDIPLYTDRRLIPRDCTTPLAAQQEPVAWKNAAIRLGEELSSVGPDGYYNMTAAQWLDWAMDQQPRGKNSLTTQPAAPVQDDRDWSLLEATQESLREHMAEIKRLKAIIEAAEKQEPVATYTCGVCGVSMRMESAAAQRQWVGFTDEEINEYDYEHRDFIYDIEALLKHKNTRLG
jgi:hypothetical protein